MNETLRQELFIELWDYDGYFPGVQNDDPLGRLIGLFCYLTVCRFLS